jgi:molybdopterin molybdotransferase
MTEPNGRGGDWTDEPKGRGPGWTDEPKGRGPGWTDEPKGRGGDWTEERGTSDEERGTSDEGRSRLEAPRRREENTALTSVETHLADILATIAPLAPTELSLSDVHGLILAEDVAASHPLPSFDNSAMDGYAVRVEDVASASEESPVTLPVVAEVAAGDTGAYSLLEGTSIRIMTGAMLPHGTEAIVPVEWTDGGTARVTIRGKPEYGNAVRLAGGDAKGGEVLVTEGTRLRPMHIAVIAAAGRGAVKVRPRPRVVVLSTGNELAEPGTPIIPGRIWDSNSFMIAAAAREAGCLAYRQAIVPDNPDEVLSAIEDQLVRADLMITTGGVSMGGEHDVVKAALRQLGTIRFRKVAMQPGMPQGFGTVAAAPAVAQEETPRRRFRRDTYDTERESASVTASKNQQVPIFTLPGNPVSAFVSFQVFARPAIGALQAYDGLGLETVRAEVTGPLRSPPGRRSFMRGVLDRSAGRVTPLTGQESHQVATLGKANALVIVPEWVVQLAEGESAEVMVLP